MIAIVKKYEHNIGEENTRRVHSKVAALVHRYKTKNPFALAILTGLKVEREKLPSGIKGLLWNGHIFTNKRLHQKQRAATVAHELGHYTLGHLDRQGSIIPMEQEAQLFAYYLTGEFNRR